MSAGVHFLIEGSQCSLLPATTEKLMLNQSQGGSDAVKTLGVCFLFHDLGFQFRPCLTPPCAVTFTKRNFINSTFSSDARGGGRETTLDFTPWSVVTYASSTSLFIGVATVLLAFAIFLEVTHMIEGQH